MVDDRSTRAAGPIQERKAPAPAHHHTSRILVGGRDVDKPGLSGDGVDHKALFVDRNADHVQPLAAKQLDNLRVARLLHGDHRSGVKQHASDEVDGMARA